MTQNAARLAGVFLVGLVGWLGASVLRVEGVWLFVMPVVLGAIAGVVGPRPILLPALWLGMLAAYPAALALGVIAFLGENWALYVVVFLVTAAVGFGASLVVARGGSWPRAV